LKSKLDPTINLIRLDKRNANCNNKKSKQRITSRNNLYQGKEKKRNVLKNYL